MAISSDRRSRHTFSAMEGSNWCQAAVWESVSLTARKSESGPKAERKNSWRGRGEKSWTLEESSEEGKGDRNVTLCPREASCSANGIASSLWLWVDTPKKNKMSAPFTAMGSTDSATKNQKLFMVKYGTIPSFLDVNSYARKT